MGNDPYPVTFSVDYPDRKLNRLTTFFRIFTVIPILILAGAISGTVSGSYGDGTAGGGIMGFGAGLLFLPTLLMIVFRQRYPRWWFDWNLQFLRFSNRVGVYVFLMDDRYPSTEDEQAVHLDFPYPDAERDLNRWLPLVKWLLAIPHYVVLAALFFVSFFAVVAAWFAILFTGRFPRGIFDFLVGVGRWYNRVVAYVLILVTDEYPPFGFGSADPPAGQQVFPSQG